MSFKNLDNGELALVVSGQDMLLGADTIESCSVIENALSTLPSVAMKFVDTKLAASSFGLFQDGAPINLTIGDGTQSPLQFSFNQWSLTDATANSAGNVASLNGVANLLPWMSTVITKAYKGNVSDVVQQLAQQHGVPNIDVDTTQDKQTWLPDGRAVAQFVRNMVDHAWMGASSTPHLAMTSQKGQWLLRMKDILKSGSGTQSFASAGLQGTSDIIIWDYRITSKGGPLNTYVNYGHKVVQQMQNGNTSVFQNMSINKLSSFMGISSALQGAVQMARTFYHPPDQGNTHQNYAQAVHNNRMGRASFSTNIEIMTKTLSQVKLLDDVSIRLARSDGTQDAAYSGSYKVSGITRYMGTGGHYREKLSLSSQGTSADAAGGSL